MGWGGGFDLAKGEEMSEVRMKMTMTMTTTKEKKRNQSDRIRAERSQSINLRILHNSRNNAWCKNMGL